MNNEILSQLTAINESLQLIASSLGNKSFIDSQLFAALIGISSAFLVLFVERYFVYRDKINGEKEKLFEWLAQQNGFWAPDILLGEAKRSHWPANDTTAPHDLGEKMVTILRKDVKHWKFPSFRIRRLFKNYESMLKQVSDRNPKDNAEFMKKAQEIHDKISKVVFRATGENNWTAR